MRVCSVVGTGLDLLKMAPLVQEMGRRGVEQTLVHSGPIDDALSLPFAASVNAPVLATTPALDRSSPICVSEAPGWICTCTVPNPLPE